MPAIVCDRVRVEVTPIVLERKPVHTAQAQIMEIPAYTVSVETLTDRLADLWQSYCDKSAADGAPYSLGDFALFLVALASKDPFFQEE